MKRCGNCSRGQIDDVHGMIACTAPGGVLIINSPFTDGCVFHQYQEDSEQP